MIAISSCIRPLSLNIVFPSTVFELRKPDILSYLLTWSLKGKLAKLGKFFAHFTAIKSNRADVSYIVSCEEGYNPVVIVAGCGSGLKGPLLEDTPHPELGISSSSFVTSILSSKRKHIFRNTIFTKLIVSNKDVNYAHLYMKIGYIIIKISVC